MGTSFIGILVEPTHCQIFDRCGKVGKDGKMGGMDVWDPHL